MIAFDEGYPPFGVGVVNPVTLTASLKDDLTSTDTNGAFFPGGRRMVFVRDRSELWVVDYPRWQRARMILRTPEAWGCCQIVEDPVVSPSGKFIYFEAFDPDSALHAIWRLRLKDRNLRRIGIWNSSGLNLAISPDGTSIAVNANSKSDTPLDFSGISPLLLMRPDGTHQRFLDLGGRGGGEPAFSPDGKRIAFTWTFPDATYIYEKTLGSGQLPKRVEAATSLVATSPVYSPDGKDIAFQGQDFDGGEKHIYKVRLGEDRPKRLTSEGTVGPPTDWQRTVSAIVKSWNPKSKGLKLRVFSSARLRIDGKSIRSTKRKFRRAGTFRIHLKLRPRAVRKLKQKGAIAIRMRLSVKYRGIALSRLSITRIGKKL